MNRSISILRTGSFLLASLQEDLSDDEILDIQDQILTNVVKWDAKGVILDVSSVDVMDSFSTRTLADIAAAVELRGAKMAITGIQPEVALSMVLLGLKLPKTIKALDLDRAMEMLTRELV